MGPRSLHSRNTRPTWGWVLVWAALCFTLPGRAKTATGTGSGGAVSGPRVEITVKGTILSSLQIWVAGSTDLNGGQTTVINGSGTSGVVNFGVYNLAGPLLTGQKHRVN